MRKEVQPVLSKTVTPYGTTGYTIAGLLAGLTASPRDMHVEPACSQPASIPAGYPHTLCVYVYICIYFFLDTILYGKEVPAGIQPASQQAFAYGQAGREAGVRAFACIGGAGR